MRNTLDERNHVNIGVTAFSFWVVTNVNNMKITVLA